MSVTIFAQIQISGDDRRLRIWQTIIYDWNDRWTSILRLYAPSCTCRRSKFVILAKTVQFSASHWRGFVSSCLLNKNEHNTKSNLKNNRILRFMHNPKLDKLATKYFGPDVPSIQTLEQRMLLALVNTNPAMDYQSPLPENVIPVGGLHIKDPKSLPKVPFNWARN